ncbi:MAG: TIGR02302 family protein [Pseudomonadota bacterium]
MAESDDKHRTRRSDQGPGEPVVINDVVVLKDASAASVVDEADQSLEGRHGRAIRRTGKLVRQTRRTQIFQAGLDMLWPAGGFAGVFLALTFFDAWTVVPLLVHQLALVALGLGAVVALGWKAMRLSWPKPGDAEVALESLNETRHHPVATLADTPVIGGDDPVARTLWRHHQHRQTQALEALRFRWPRTEWTKYDPFGLRGMVFIGLAASVIVAWGEWGDRLQAGLSPGLPSFAPTQPPLLTAWITPPAYTGKAPVYLANARPLSLGTDGTSGGAAEPRIVTVPQNATLFVSVTGVGGEPALVQSTLLGQPQGRHAMETTAERAHEVSLTLERDQEIAVAAGGYQTLPWRIDVVPDLVPEIALIDDIASAPSGSMKFGFQLADDYGVIGARARVVLTDPSARPGLTRTDALPPQPTLNALSADTAESQAAEPPKALVFDLPLRALRLREATEETQQNFSEHPFAGLPVTLLLEAEDEAGQIGRSLPHEFTFPERSFADPLARAIIEQRRLLALDPALLPFVRDAWNAMLIGPEAHYDEPPIYLGMQVVSAYLANNDRLRSDQYTDLIDLMWDLALRVENGDLSLAEANFRQIQQALMEALKNGASSEEIARLMDQLRQAMAEYLQAMREQAQQAMEDGEANQAPQSGQQLSDLSLQQMLDAIEELAQTGARDLAQQMLAQLQAMMDNLSVDTAAGGQSQSEQMLSESLNALGDMIGGERALLDQTYQHSRGQTGSGSMGGAGETQDNAAGEGPQSGAPQPGTQEPGNGEPGGPMSYSELAERQRDLARRLSELNAQIGGGGIESPQALREAERAMGEAERALEQGLGDAAAERQNEAIEALRDGAISLAEQLLDERRRRLGMSGGADDDVDMDDRTDPLGRPSATAGADLGDSVKVPDEIALQRVRELLEEIQERASELNRPQNELDYLERLLKRF